MTLNLRDILSRSPIIAAVRDREGFEAALASRTGIIFLLAGEILNLKRLVGEARASGKTIFLHMDLIAGLSHDAAAVRYLAEEIGPDGIISTRHSLIAMAGKANMAAIQRFFLLDSPAVEAVVHAAGNSGPQAVEVLPGVIPRVIGRIAGDIRLPLIAGGLIETEEDILGALRAGAVAVSMSRREFWNMEPGIGRQQ